MRKIIILTTSLFTFIFYSFTVFAQVQDLNLSVKQFAAINKAKADIDKIKKGVTSEAEIQQWFGKPNAEITNEDPATQKDKDDFDKFLRDHIPAELNPQYSLPTGSQKILYYVFPWTFEHPVPNPKGKGEYIQTENVVILVTVNKKTGIVEDSKFFDFYFYQKWEGNLAL